MGVAALVSTDLPQGSAWLTSYAFHADSMNPAVIFVINSDHTGTRFQPHGRKGKVAAELETLLKKLRIGWKDPLLSGRVVLSQETARVWAYKCIFFSQKVIIHWSNHIKIKSDGGFPFRVQILPSLPAEDVSPSPVGPSGSLSVCLCFIHAGQPLQGLTDHDLF